MRRLGLRIPAEMLRQLRFGRALDNRRLTAAGYAFRYTTREAVLKLREHQRLAPLLRGAGGDYRYEREVEEFLRWSPSVRAARASGGGGGAPARAVAAVRDQAADIAPAAYDDLRADEVVAILPSLAAEDLEALRRHEEEHGNRSTVLGAIARNLARRAAPTGPD